MKDTTRLRIYIAFDMAGTKEVEVTYKKITLLAYQFFLGDSLSSIPYTHLIISIKLKRKQSEIITKKTSTRGDNYPCRQLEKSLISTLSYSLAAS